MLEKFPTKKSSEFNSRDDGQMSQHYYPEAFAYQMSYIWDTFSPPSMRRCLRWLAAQAGIGQVRSRLVDVANRPWKLRWWWWWWWWWNKCLVRCRPWKHGDVPRNWNSLPGNCYFHLQLLVFCLNGFIRVDPRNDCLQPLLLLPLPHVTIHVSDKCLHIPFDVLYQNFS